MAAFRPIWHHAGPRAARRRTIPCASNSGIPTMDAYPRHADQKLADKFNPEGGADARPRWPPPLSLIPSRLDPEPQPPGTALRIVFGWAYLTMPAWVWGLPIRQQSDAVFRAICQACRCYTPGCQGFDYMALDPVLHGHEYCTITALADVDVEDFIASMHDDPDDDYPVAKFDPDRRRPPRAGHA
jgi:hypothetical protein